ncbi:ligand-binding sensor domain-containing diguanylate cyclase [Thermomonas fusca]|uniref:diguanylate cyclase n=1 Tax=Thermomonas fusca TaxID=215690 RepID=A0A5R9PJN4_9GAMM|nr:ligand-binding sensor domain-containing diguanylate cyclase [Thermomonas fusca]TLX23193.1 GGDEF domain-containing protein [Thermomonas fusca]
MRPWLLLLTLATPLSAGALEADKPFSDYVVDSWDVKQGLPQISVLAMTQDADGYLWFGTQGGLARFDGVRFHRYNPRDTLGVNSNIQALLADRQRRLWIGTTLGLLVLEDGRFRRVLPADADGKPALAFPVRALAMTDGRVLVAGAEGVYTPEGGRLRLLHALPEPALSLLVRPDGLWAGGAGRVYRIRPGTTEAIPLPAAAGSPVTALAWHHGRIWAGGNRGLFRLQHGVFLGAGTGNAPTIEAMASDRDDNLWIATSQYLERWRGGQPIERIQDSRGSIAIRAIYEDHDGNLWLGSQTEGVARVWNGYTRRLDHAVGLANPLLWAISGAPDGSVWLGTVNGVEVWRNGRIQQAVAGARLPHPEAYSLLAEAGQVWIGTRAGAAVLRDGRLEQPAVLAPLRNLQINGIVRDRGGRLWFASSDGLFMLGRDHRLLRYGPTEGLADARIRIVHETRDGRLLVGSTRGLYEWRDGRILALGRQTGLDDEIAVTALLELANGHWLVGSSNGDSLHLFDGKRWHAFGSSRGLPINIPFHLAEDAGSLWVAGMQGVYRLPLAQLERALQSPALQLDPQLVINSGFDRPGGQQDKCCNGSGNGRGLLRDGQLWLPTRDGALLVQLATAEAGTPRPVRIEAVATQGRAYAAGQDALRLPMDARDLRFDFTVPAFQPTRLPRLRYRLVGFEQRWRELDNPSLRSASYINLPPGEYRFEVADFSRADPLAGSARLDVAVPPHLYETLAFRVLAGLLAVGLVWLGYLGLRHRYARQRMVLEQLVQERTRDLQAANARLKEISFTDPLTGLHNRRYLTQQIPVDLSFYQRDPDYREGREALVIALLDVDHFKVINDTWGHAAGDRVLEQLGQLLGELKRSGDYVARWGGEEFLLVLRPLPRGSVASIGERLCSRIAAHRFDLGNGAEHRLTVSVGLVECPLFRDHPDLLGWEQLVTLADRAMYAVKNSGRNGWMGYRPLPQARLPEDVSGYRDNPRQLLDSGLLELFGASASTTAAAAPAAPPPQPG